MKTLSKYILLLASLAYEADGKSLGSPPKNNKTFKPALTLGYTGIPPHIYQGDNGEAVGALAEFIQNYLAPEIGVKIQLVNLPLPRVFKGMNELTIDGMAFAGASNSRKENYLFPQQHLTSTTPVLAVNAKNNIKDLDINQLTVGYLDSGVISPYLCKKQAKISSLYGSKIWHRNLKRLILGRLDAAYSPSKLNMSFVIKENRISEQVSIIHLPESPLKWFTIFSKSKAN